MLSISLWALWGLGHLFILMSPAPKCAQTSPLRVKRNLAKEEESRTTVGTWGQEVGDSRVRHEEKERPLWQLQVVSGGDHRVLKQLSHKPHQSSNS